MRTNDKKRPEDAIIDGPGDASDSIGGLLAGLALDHPLRPNLDPRLAERLDQVESIHLQGSGHFSRERVRALK